MAFFLGTTAFLLLGQMQNTAAEVVSLISEKQVFEGALDGFIVELQKPVGPGSFTLEFGVKLDLPDIDLDGSGTPFIFGSGHFDLVAFGESASTLKRNAVFVSMWAPQNQLTFGVMINGRNSMRKSYASPVLLSDGAFHTITISVNTEDNMVLYAVDGKTIVEEMDYVFSLDGMAQYEYVALGGSSWMELSEGMIGEMDRAEIFPGEYRVPSETWSEQDKHDIPLAGYGSCVIYDETRFGDKGLCAGILTNRSIFVPNYGLGINAATTVWPSITAILNFLPASCVEAQVPFLCLKFLSPCAEIVNANGDTHAYPRLTCKDVCTSYQQACLIDAGQAETSLTYPGFEYTTLSDVLGDCDDATPEQTHNSPMRDNAVESYVTTYHGSPLFPETHTILPDGTAIPCAKAGDSDFVFVQESISCPEPFVAFERNSGEKSPDGTSCAIPCPSFLFSPEERHAMWSTYCISGMAGFFLNLGMVGHSFFEAKSGRKKTKVPLTIRYACYLGLLYGMCHVIPSLVLEKDLPCNSCADEWCHGESFACSLSAVAVYLLLAIVFLVSRTLFDLLLKCWNVPRGKQGKLKSIFSMVSGVYCLVLAIICLVADSLPTDEGTPEFHRLAAARDSFACNPKYATYLQEMLLYTIPFVIATGVMLFCLTSVVKIFLAVKGKTKAKETVTNKKTADSVHKKTARKIPVKLLFLGGSLIVLMVIQLVVLSVQAPVFENYNAESKTWQTCIEQKFVLGGSSFDELLGSDTSCGALPTTRPSVAASIFQGLIQNSLSCLVGAIWGVPQVYKFILRASGNKTSPEFSQSSANSSASRTSDYSNVSVVEENSD